MVAYDAVRHYIRRWTKEREQATAAAYVPLSLPGGSLHFDWSHEVVVKLSGVTGHREDCPCPALPPVCSL